MSESLYSQIEKANEIKVEEKQNDNVGESAWLVFTVGSENYALKSSSIREILRNNEIYPMPFVPSYIKGVLNYYGEPYAVVDIQALSGGEKLDGRLFMILKDQNKISLQVSEIQEFHSDKDVIKQKLQNNQDSTFFSGAITFDSITAPIINIKGITEKIRVDIENN